MAVVEGVYDYYNIEKKKGVSNLGGIQFPEPKVHHEKIIKNKIKFKRVSGLKKQPNHKNEKQTKYL